VYKRVFLGGTCKNIQQFRLFLQLLRSVARPYVREGQRLTFTVWYSKIKQGLQLWLYFSVFRRLNLTFDKTLMMQLCYFSAKIATFWAINV